MTGARNPIRIALLDDHAIVREGVRRLLDDCEDMSVVGEAGCGRLAIALVEETRPDIAILDVNLRDVNGITVARHLARSVPETRTIILSVSEERIYVREALAAGVRGYVLKRSAGENLLHAVRAVHVGGLYIDPTIADRRLLSSSAKFADEPLVATGAPITEREQDVLRYIALGFTTKEIAAKLSISMKSIETHKVRACEKLNIRGRPKIVQYAVLRGWLQKAGEQGRIVPCIEPAAHAVPLEGDDFLRADFLPD